jgi:hypothetical protein
MNADQISGRLVALEVLSTLAIGLYLVNSRNDPDYSKAEALLSQMQQKINSQAQTLPPEARAAAREYGEHLRSLLSKALRSMRIEEGARS